MPSFKHLVALALTSALLVACTKADVKPDGVNGNDGGEGAASFRVRSLDGDATVLQVPDRYTDPATQITFLSSWRVPREANFRFTACIQDRASREDAVGHQFAVEIPGRGRLEDIAPTSGGGCFSWFESVPFNFFVRRSKWTIIERDIVGTGIHTGRQRVRIAVNPWAASGGPTRDSGDQVRFLRDKPLNPAMLVESAQANAAFAGDLLGEDALYVDDLSIQTLRRGESSQGMFLRFNITMHPKIRFENQAGVPQYIPVTSGDFYVIGHLVLNNTGNGLRERTILTTGSDLPAEFRDRGDVGVLGQGRVVDGKLVARLDAWVNARLPQGNLELAIKIIPKGVRGLGEFQGIYELGSLRNLSSNFSGGLSPACREGGGCDVVEYLKTATGFEELKQRSEASDNFPYLIDRVRLRFVQVQPGETTTERTVGYSASVCVTDSYTGDSPVGLAFRVRYEDTGETHELKTEGDGCLYWSSNIFHYYYHPEEFIEKTVTIERSTGVSRQVKFHINPWDDKFTFGFDDIEFRPEFWAELKRRKKVPARFFLSDYTYHTVRFQYNIDSLMGLEVKKTVLMEIQPRVLRYSGIVNARKMTEPTRDGIWLMKVAIQKNYLDPSEMGVFIDRLKDNRAQIRLQDEPEEYKEIAGATRLRDLGIEARSKEFIATRTVLIRSTDGVVVQPVELSMYDLRLMRTRSNFLIQIEPVDERQLQKENVLHAGLSRTIEELLAERSAKAEELGTTPDDMPEEEIVRQEEERIKQMVAERASLTRRLFDDIGQQLFRTGQFQVNLAPYRLTREQLDYVSPLLERLQIELEINDFTNIKLPSCEEVDCNSFIAPNSGLEKRTFVGPVIYLSNGYSDSVRATDNLDEARCGRKVEFDDPLEAALREEERLLFADAETRLAPLRLNTNYQFSPFFGSLRHLCGKHVDDLIVREKEDRLLYEQNAPAVASTYRYVEAYKMDYASLTDTPLKRVDLDEATLRRCNFDLTSCMTETDQYTVKLPDLLERVNRNLEWAKDWTTWITRNIFGEHLDPVKDTPWTASDVARGLFATDANPRERRYTGCSIAMSQLAEQLKARAVEPEYGDDYEDLEYEFMRACMLSAGEPIFWDRKLRVIKTGQVGNTYVFLGGYQMNINVGQSFSISRSDSYSRSWGIEGTDFIAPFLRGFGRLGDVLKPFSLKLSGSESFSSSNGTSVTDSTYLVAQIAKFRVRLDEYERCVGLKIRPELLDHLRFRASSGVIRTVERNLEAFATARPIFICEGRIVNEPKFVDEMYFYFTQHFTEGDMLDQADLYNHPWLLALRGYRDFGAFVESVHAQEAVSFWDAVNGNAFQPSLRPIDWPLQHMRDTYKQMSPTFPGMYTVLDEAEGMTEFPLEQRLELIDHDINREVVTDPTRRAIPGR